MVTMNGNEALAGSRDPPDRGVRQSHGAPVDFPPGIRRRTFLIAGRMIRNGARSGSRSQGPPEPRLPQPRTRIRMTALGAARCPNLAGREGVVIGTGRYRSTVRVMFDGFRSATSLHSTYIEAVAGEGSSSRDRR